MRAVADNDILLKAACYGLLPRLMATVPGDGAFGILGASRFVVSKTIMRTPLRGDPCSAKTQFLVFLTENEVIEPSAEEQHLAADFEAAAQKTALNLDAGESQLVAILVSRGLLWLVMGDKRAVASVETLLDTDERLQVAAGKVRCLEQLVADALATGNPDQIRRAICDEPSVDKTLSICFSCSSPEASSVPLEALSSYISDLRARAVRVLATK
jgi:hypothetical protein